ncbi:MAG: discoidin domain-containing protein [Sphingobacteriaceae bacterium]
MKTLHNLFRKGAYQFLAILTSVLIISGCTDEWEPAMSEIPAGKTTLQISTNDKADGKPVANVKVAVYSKVRGAETPKLVFEGRSNTEGKLTVPDFEVPNQAQIQMTDSRFPPANPVTVKVLSEKSASVVLEVSKTWSEDHIYPRADWEAIAVSSQNGSSGGHNVLLDNTSTWHTKYSPTLEDFPHWIILDMKEQKAVHGFALKQRSNNNGPIKGVEFYVSNDNQTWNKVLTTEIPYVNPGAWQVLVLDDETSGRYVKLVVTSGHLEGTKFINLERLGVF